MWFINATETCIFYEVTILGQDRGQEEKGEDIITEIAYSKIFGETEQDRMCIFFSLQSVFFLFEFSGSHGKCLQYKIQFASIFFRSAIKIQQLLF